MKALSSGVLAIVLPATFASPAFAQSSQPAQPGPAAEASSSVAEVVVTARRREENIEKVPIAITAIGGQQMRDRSIFSDTDLQRAVPGLTIRQNGRANQFNYAINLAQSQLTNLATAESRIRDADLASEAANLTKAQILMQAGVAALAQANAAPQAVLSLLKS